MLAFAKSQGPPLLLSMNQQKDSSCDPLTPDGHDAELWAEVFSSVLSGGRRRFPQCHSTVVGLFRLGTIGQEPHPAWTIGTFNELEVGGATHLSFT